MPRQIRLAGNLMTNNQLKELQKTMSWDRWYSQIKDDPEYAELVGSGTPDTADDELHIIYKRQVAADRAKVAQYVNAQTAPSQSEGCVTWQAIIEACADNGGNFGYIIEHLIKPHRWPTERGRYLAKQFYDAYDQLCTYVKMQHDKLGETEP